MLPIVLYNIPYLYVKCVNTVSQQKKKEKEKLPKISIKKGQQLLPMSQIILLISSYTLHTTITIRLK